MKRLHNEKGQPSLIEYWKKDQTRQVKLICRGTFHQASERFAQNGGAQCMANALTALAASVNKSPTTWNSSDMDSILYQGDLMYSQIRKVDVNSKSFLLPCELPKVFQFDSLSYDIIQQQPYIGRLLDKSFDPPIQNLLETAFDDSGDNSDISGSIMMMREYAIAIIKSKGTSYYVFDSHCRASTGMPCPTGKSVLLDIGPNVSNILAYITKLSKHLNLPVDAQFELIPVVIKKHVDATLSSISEQQSADIFSHIDLPREPRFDVSQCADTGHQNPCDTVSEFKSISSQSNYKACSVTDSSSSQAIHSGDPMLAEPVPKEFKKKPGSKSGRVFQQSWKVRYPWLRQFKTKDDEVKVLCDICSQCHQKGLLQQGTGGSGQRDEAFTVIGFSNWKHALRKFEAHEQSQVHNEGVVKLKTMQQGINVGAFLSSAMQKQLIQSRLALMTLVTSLRFLCQQGLAIRGHNESDSNFSQLLQLRSDDVPELKQWLARSSYRWISHDVQNELLNMMAVEVMRVISTDIKANIYFSVMMDETTDVSVREQASICIRHVTNSLEVEEDFLGFYETSSTTAVTLLKILLDVLLRCGLSLSDCRGQVFDGASAMAGRISGLQTRVKELQPKAIFVHCSNHSLNLAVQDALSLVPECRDAINMVKDLVNIVRGSAKRLAWFEQIQLDSDNVERGHLRPLCPTRWTMRICSVTSVLKNYQSLITFMQEMSDNDHTEIGSRCAGFLKQMLSFQFYFSINLLQLVFSRTESAATSLQSRKISLSEAAQMITCLLQSMAEQRSDVSFELYWKQVTESAAAAGIDEPKVLRTRRLPKHLEYCPTGSGAAYSPTTPEDRFRRIYAAALDTAHVAISSRFDSVGVKVATSIEQVIVSASQGKEIDLSEVMKVYADDLDEERLKLHISMFGDICKSQHVVINNMEDVRLFLHSRPELSLLLPEVHKLVRLLLVLPVTTSTAERSFSTLRRVKTYLRSTMSQKRLNHVCILHTYKEVLERLDLRKLCNEFISKSPQRSNNFALFPI